MRVSSAAKFSAIAIYLSATSGAFAVDTPTKKDAPDLSGAAKKLIHAATGIKEPLFAAVDGAQYGDLPNLLKELGLYGRSLFLDHADKDIEAASGWLVPLGGGKELAALLEASDADCGSLVLWSYQFSH